jgi:hypothetical protein
VAWPLAAQPPAPVGTEASFLLPVLHYLHSMQQQTFDQFNQTLMMIFQMFTTTHQDHLALIRRELEEVRKATEEIQALRQQLEQSAAPPPTSAPAALPGPQEEGVEEGGRVAPTAAGSSPDGQQSTPAAGPAPNGKMGQPPPPPPGPQAGPAPSVGGDTIHAWLTQRIAALQQEREGRWQKILRLLLGR